MILTVLGFLGFLMAASGMNDEAGDPRVNIIFGIISLAIMLVGFAKKKREVRE